MTPLEQNIALSKIHGAVAFVFDYLHDLNAVQSIYDLRIRGNIVLEQKFYGNLRELYDRNADGSHRYGSTCYEMASAPAFVRAKAILMTFDKWEGLEKPWGI